MPIFEYRKDVEELKNRWLREKDKISSLWTKNVDALHKDNRRLSGKLRHKSTRAEHHKVGFLHSLAEVKLFPIFVE